MSKAQFRALLQMKIGVVYTAHDLKNVRVDTLKILSEKAYLKMVKKYGYISFPRTCIYFKRLK